MVRNEEKKAFRDLTPKERGEIVEAWIASGIEAWTGNEWTSQRARVSHLYDLCAYRIRPRQLVIPWEVIRPEYKWAFISPKGIVAFSEVMPGFTGDEWLCPWPGAYNAIMLNIDTTGIDWRESLTERPEGV